MFVRQFLAHTLECGSVCTASELGRQSQNASEVEDTFEKRLNVRFPGQVSSSISPYTANVYDAVHGGCTDADQRDGGPALQVRGSS